MYTSDSRPFLKLNQGITRDQFIEILGGKARGQNELFDFIKIYQSAVKSCYTQNQRCSKVLVRIYSSVLIKFF